MHQEGLDHPQQSNKTQAGSEKQKTFETRADDSRGRHTTTKRELIIFPTGGVLIDTPGMRELGLWSSGDSVDSTFEDIENLARRCKFNDCDHIRDNGCEVLCALKSGQITQDRYDRYIKLRSGLDHVKNKKEKNFAQAQKRSRQNIIKRAYFIKK